MSMSISVIIPTYNEKGNIVPLLERVHKALSAYAHEIIFVDDNSRDGTAETAGGMAAKYHVKVFVRKDERGLATAVIHGLKQASGEIIVVMDADLQHPPEVVPGLVKAIEDGADFAVGSRYVPGGGCPNWDLTRKIVSKTAILIAHVLLPVTRQIKDATSGFYAFRREGIAGADFQPIGYKIMLEMLIMGKFHKVVEVPYVFRERSAGRSKFNTRQQIEYLRHIFSLMSRTGELTRFLKFCAVGLSGVGVNEGIYWLLTRLSGLQPVPSQAISVEASVITNFLLNDYFTFSDRRKNTGSLLSRLLRFNLVSLVGLGINLLVFWVVHSILGVYDLLAVLVGIAVATVWNYFVNTTWTWK